MLKVTIPASEYFNSQTNEFIETKEQQLQLEHSLVSLSKWESKWKKPYLVKKTKTTEETIDYIKCMTLTQNVDPNIYLAIPSSVISKITKYIEDPMTATIVPKIENKKGRQETITGELIYYWMIVFNVPFECQKWHLNRLLTLINVCSVKQAPKKKMSKAELMARNKALNEQRKKELNTKG